MDRVSGKEDASVTVVVGQQQVLAPRRARQHLVLDRHGDRFLEHRLHIVIAIDNRMQGKVTGRVLHDQEGRICIGDVIVPAFADRDALEQIVATI